MTSNPKYVNAIRIHLILLNVATKSVHLCLEQEVNQNLVKIISLFFKLKYYLLTSPSYFSLNSPPKINSNYSHSFIIFRDMGLSKIK